MRNLSTEFRRQLYYGNRKYLAYADITLTDGTELNLTNSEIWSGGFSIEQAVSDDDKFTALGSVIIGSATVIINNIEGTYSEYDFTNATVVLRVGLQLNSNTEIIKLGTYRVDDATYNGGTITLSLLDYMEQFDRPYVTTLTYPTTLDAILRDCCLKCGVQLSTLDFPHKTLTVNSPPTENTVTFREVVSWIATIAGCYAKCDENGRLVLEWFNIDGLNNDVGFDGGLLEKALPYNSGIIIDGGSFNPWTVGDIINGGNFTSYTETSYDGGDLEHTVPYISGDNVEGGRFNPWGTGSPEIVDGGEFTDTYNYHLFYNLKSQNICVDNTVITGLSIVIEDENATDRISYSGSGINRVTIITTGGITTYTIGTTDYVIQIENNEFITASNIEDIIRWLAVQFIGLEFRKMNISKIDDPSIESGDVAKVIDRKGNEYNILVTRATFSIGRYQTIVCGSETPLRNSAIRFSEATKNYVKSKKLLKQEQTNREQAYEELNAALQATGMFSTDITDPTTGAVTHYLHNKPLLSDSKIVWKMTSEAFGVTTNYNGDQTVWTAGLTASGTALVQRLSAIGIDADWINTGTISSRDGTVAIDLDNNTINLKGITSFTDFATKSGLAQSNYTTINGSNITTGSIKDANSNTVFNLSDGSLTIKKGSINIGSGVFEVSTTGALTSTSANIKGKLQSSTSANYVIVDNGHIYGGRVSSGNLQTSNGYISFNQRLTNGNGYGTRIGGESVLALLTPMLGVGDYQSFDSHATIYVGQSKTIDYVKSIGSPGVTITPSYAQIFDQISQHDIQVLTDVNVSVTINYTTGSVGFIKGLMATQ